VLSGRGTELERAYGLGVVRQCLAPAMHAAGPEERERLLAGAAAIAEPVVLDGPGEERASTPFAMLHALYWLVSNLVAERGPALVVMDDAQWADEPSLRFLAFLQARHLRAPRARRGAGACPRARRRLRSASASAASSAAG
jgi:hypothetical protein